MRVLSITAPGDRLLATVAPLGLACAAGTALLVDLDPIGPRYPGSGSLAGLVEAGPRASDLRPRQRGVAVLRNGGIEPDAAQPVLQALIEGWPAVVLRLSEGTPPPGDATVVYALLAGLLRPPVGDRVVYQRTSLGVSPPGPGPVLPKPGVGVLRRLLSGLAPGPSRWVQAWKEVWQWA